MSATDLRNRRNFLKRSLAWVGAFSSSITTSRGASTASQPALPVRMEAPFEVAPVTRPPGHHFFGYYDKSPWNASGRRMLAMAVDYFDRNPEKGEALTLGTIDRDGGNTFEPFGRTLAWSWQQGTMLQWLGMQPEAHAIYNTVDEDRYVAVIRNVRSGQIRTLPRSIYTVSRDGHQALTLDFERVNRLRPGYGYIALPERDPDNPAPDDRGIYWMDTKTGENKLIITLAWAATHRPADHLKEGQHWFNHLLFNPSGTRFIFLHRWRNVGRRSWWTRLYTANRDGGEIRLLSDHGMVSHFDWRDDHTILAWTRTPDDGNHFYLIDDRTGEHTVFGGDVLTQDGHCSWSPDRRWVLNDTYPDKQRMQTLMLYHPETGRRIDIGRFYQPPELYGRPYRCDLHPRWNRRGTQVCIDSTHEGSRQMYVIDVSAVTS
jgi:Tol biopolymer transport system component